MGVYNYAWEVSPSESLDGFLSSITDEFELPEDKRALQIYWFHDGQPKFVRKISSLNERENYYVRCSGDPTPLPLHPSRHQLAKIELEKEQAAREMRAKQVKRQLEIKEKETEVERLQVKRQLERK